MHGDGRESEIVNDAPPFHFGPAEVDEQGQVKPEAFK